MRMAGTFLLVVFLLFVFLSGLNGLVEVESRMERVLGSRDRMFTPPLRFGVRAVINSAISGVAETIERIFNKGTLNVSHEFKVFAAGAEALLEF